MTQRAYQKFEKCWLDALQELDFSTPKTQRTISDLCLSKAVPSAGKVLSSLLHLAGLH